MPAGHERANFGQLYAAVSEVLAAGLYRPGDRIELKALSSRLGVSVTPLREVLSRLVGRDIVTERRSEGYYLARLDAHDIADLYKLHHICIERAIAVPPAHDVDLDDGPADMWKLFDALVAASGDRILAGVRRYLDERLMLIRRYELHLLGNEQQTMQRLRSAVSRHDADAMRSEVATFHSKRTEIASDIADLLNRGRLN
jgi:DNA-binding GntR family transcriptional regulator